MRLIHAESDGLPGLIVDQYGDVLVMQIGSAGAERWRDTSPISCRNSASLSAYTSDPIPTRAHWKGWSCATAYCAVLCRTMWQ